MRILRGLKSFLLIQIRDFVEVLILKTLTRLKIGTFERCRRDAWPRPALLYSSDEGEKFHHRARIGAGDSHGERSGKEEEGSEGTKSRTGWGMLPHGYLPVKDLLLDYAMRLNQKGIGLEVGRGTGVLEERQGGQSKPAPSQRP